MESITIKDLTFSYQADCAFSLDGISLSVEAGEIVLITGVSGCGKTTLLRHLKKAYMPVGVRSEESQILLGDKAIEDLDDVEGAQLVGFVGQDVEAGQVTDTVWHELAFGLENLGYSQKRMHRKIAEMTAFFGLESIYHKKLSELSGGQKQLVNLAAVMAMEPKILVLDEPTSQLDPLAAGDFFQMVKKIHDELGTTIVMTEHRLEEVLALCDRMYVMESGSILMEGTPKTVACALFDKKHVLYEALPSVAKLYCALSGKEGEIPLTVNGGRQWLRKYMESEKQKSNLQDGGNYNQLEKSKHAMCNGANKKEKDMYGIRTDEVWFRYDKDGNDILKACNLNVKKGTITAILGGNGAGKSTLLNVLAGYFRPYLGKVRLENGLEDSIGMLPQNPQAMFAKKTVREELEVSSDVNRGIALQEVIQFCGLQRLLEQHPFDLSGGEMQKLALAKLLLEDKELLLLDEPGKGMDYHFKCEMGNMLHTLTDRGKTIVLVSHDVEFCARFADKCGLFFDGNVVSLTNSHDFFLENTFYTTAIARICKGILPDIVLIEDVLARFAGACDERLDEDNGTQQDNSDAEGNDICPDNEGNYEVDARIDKRSLKEGKNQSKDIVANVMSVKRKKQHDYGCWLSACIVFLIMPATIYVGHAVLLQRKYYFISLLLVIEAIAAFFVRYETRKPRVREIMVLAVMSAIVVASRAMFYMVPAVKPMATLVIITGIALGAESGFLVGAMAMLVSNVFFGQGPWTPWQMFAMGLLGFLAGILFGKKKCNTMKKKIMICFFGLCSVLVVYGGIMNTASVLMYQENVNWNMIFSAVALGFPYDLIHAVATFVFLWVGLRPLLDKLERVRERL